MAQTALEYYGDKDNFGNYTYVFLSEIIDEFLLMATDDDSYLKNTNRNAFLLHCKSAIKTLTKDIPGGTYAIERTVGEQLYFPLPQDYVSYVSISVVIDGKLQPLDINKDMIIATGYLQDNNYELLFDEEGAIITADSSNVYNKPYKKYEFCDDFRGGYFELDTSKLSRYGEYTIDEINGIISFSSDLYDKHIVIEYKSDGMQWEKIDNRKIRVNKRLVNVVKDLAYFTIIAYKRNVPQYEKDRALKRYKTTAHQAKIDMSEFNINQISRMVDTNPKY